MKDRLFRGVRMLGQLVTCVKNRAFCLKYRIFTTVTRLFLCRNPKSTVRILATIPHPQMKISIFQWNEKWIIEFEGGAYKQSFRLSQESVASLEEVKKMITPRMIEGAIERFRSMHADFGEAYQQIKPTN